MELGRGHASIPSRLRQTSGWSIPLHENIHMHRRPSFHEVLVVEAAMNEELGPFLTMSSLARVARCLIRLPSHVYLRSLWYGARPWDPMVLARYQGPTKRRSDAYTLHRRVLPNAGGRCYKD